MITFYTAALKTITLLYFVNLYVAIDDVLGGWALCTRRFLVVSCGKFTQFWWVFLSPGYFFPRELWWAWLAVLSKTAKSNLRMRGLYKYKYIYDIYIYLYDDIRIIYSNCVYWVVPLSIICAGIIGYSLTGHLYQPSFYKKLDDHLPHWFLAPLWLGPKEFNEEASWNSGLRREKTLQNSPKWSFEPMRKP